MLISCIMPTRGRRDYVLRAIRCFLFQDWEEKELVIVDDADNPSLKDWTFLADQFQYMRLEKRLTVGAKRNIACSRAHGDIICHWDDDDWSAPGRLEHQVAFAYLRGNNFHPSVTGYHSMVFEDETGERWKYSGKPDYALGTSLMYWRDWWEEHPFRDIDVSEDNVFVTEAAKAGRLISIDAGDYMIASIHSGNTSPRRMYDGQNLRAEWSRVEELIA